MLCFISTGLNMHELPLVIYEQQTLLITLFWVLECNHICFAWMVQCHSCPLPGQALGIPI